MKSKQILTLLNLPKIGRKKVQKVIESNISCEDIDELLIEINKNTNLKLPIDEEIVKSAIDNTESIIKKCEENSIEIIGFNDTDYPARLKTIPDPPVILFVKGNKELLQKDSVAVVGTREPIEYGYKVATRLATRLTEKGFAIVSGLAIGIDSAAHIACLDAKGNTVAVMPCGLDKVYPAKNKKLAQRILESDGCLISEYPPDTVMRKNHFVERDRIQSGLSKGVIVVETTIDGGTMHTANFALKQERHLGCFYPSEKYIQEINYQGNIKLLKDKRVVKIEDEASLQNYIKLI